MAALDAACEVAFLLRGSADEAERLRRLPETVHRALLNAGLYHPRTKCGRRRRAR